MPLINKTGPYGVQIPAIGLTDQTVTPDAPAAGTQLLFTKSDGLYTVNSSGSVVGPMGSTVVNDYICIQDQKSSGTDGGTFTSGAWRTRDLNTEVSDSGNHASVAANQITLDTGTYIVSIFAPSYNVQQTQLRLRDITHNVTLCVGQSLYGGIYSAGSYPGGVVSVLRSYFSITGSTIIEVCRSVYKVF